MAAVPLLYGRDTEAQLVGQQLCHEVQPYTTTNNPKTN